ncbi:MAG: methyltransferase domain-containing protein [Planctomycetes bacterium]|nr:methyltransferase domain-containing protein [Planctomycetota bacterium]
MGAATDTAGGLQVPPREAWASLHAGDTTWQERIIGDIAEVYVRPRYERLFGEAFGGAPRKSFLELGAGIGTLSERLVARHRGAISRYVTLEQFAEGTRRCAGRGLASIQGDATRLPVADKSFDVVLSFDVMHHVDDPRAMAREMVRVARHSLLLTESNGLSLGRRLMELTPGHRRAGERSYLPRTYRRFLEATGARFHAIRIAPFLFPFRVPRALLPALAWFNGRVEDLPLVRWQCSSLIIHATLEA